jgi:hypothetical protein
LLILANGENILEEAVVGADFCVENVSLVEESVSRIPDHGPFDATARDPKYPSHSGQKM